jgi:hypothetical protein
MRSKERKGGSIPLLATARIYNICIKHTDQKRNKGMSQETYYILFIDDDYPKTKEGYVYIINKYSKELRSNIVEVDINCSTALTFWTRDYFESGEKLFEELKKYEYGEDDEGACEIMIQRSHDSRYESFRLRDFDYDKFLMKPYND